MSAQFLEIKQLYRERTDSPQFIMYYFSQTTEILIVVLVTFFFEC